MEERLREEARSIEAQLKAGEGDMDEGFADTAQATAGRSEMMALEEQLTTTRSEVEAALDRLEDGTYGRCEACRADIPIERLEAVPTASLCVTCKQERG